MSFFDEADELEETPSTEPRRSRSMPRRRSSRSDGGSRRPPGDRHQQEIQNRRLIAAVVIVVIVIVMALLIHGCQVSQTNDSLKNYNADVSKLITDSNDNGASMFNALESGDLSSSGIETLQNKLNSNAATARTQLSTAESFGAPGQMTDAQAALVQTMELRSQAISKIAEHIQGAASKTTSKDAVYDISVATSMLYGSDVMYKTFVTPDIAKALNGAGIPIGSGEGAQQINPGQILHDLGWLNSDFIAKTVGAQVSTSAANAANNSGSGPHGHQLNYVTVNGTQLITTTTNTIPASSTPPKFTLNVTNSGVYNEYDVECKVSVEGLSDTGTATIPETIKGQTTTCSVTLPSAVPSGVHAVTAEVVPVPRETVTSNNIATYTVTFN